MVAAAETAPIERIPLQKDGGGRKRPKVQTSAQPPRRCIAARSPHRCTARTAVPPLRCRPKSKGPQKAAAPDSLLFAAEATFAALTPVFAHRARCRIDAPRSLG